MRLIEVAVPQRGIRQADAGALPEIADERREAQHAREDLRRDPELVTELRREVPIAPARLAGKRSDARATAEPQNAIPRMANGWRHGVCGCEPCEQGAIEKVEACVPRCRVVKTPGQLLRETAEHILWSEGLVRQVVERVSHEEPQAEQREVDLHAV